MGKRIIGFVVAAVLMLGVNPVEVSAAFVNEEKVQTQANEIEVLQATITGSNEMPEIVPYATVFNVASVSAVYDEAGMHIDIITTMNGVASVVGVKDIEIQKKTWYGGWTTVATSTGGESYNVMTSVCSLTYTGTVAGETYRVVRTHYGNVDGYRELSGETGGFLCDIGYGG